MTRTVLVRRITESIKKLWRNIFSSANILWLLIIALVIGVILISSAWDLESAQIVSASMAALAIPLAFMTQRAILRENQRMTLRQQANADLQKQFEILRDTLITFSVSSPDRKYAVIEQSVAILNATASLTYTYHAHEMVFIKIDRYFKYFHFSLLKLTRVLDQVANLGRFNGYGDTVYDDEAKVLLLFNQAKEQADDLKSYLYDFQKEIIEELGFSRLFGVVVEKRQPKFKKYKTLSEVATKKKVQLLEKEFDGEYGYNESFSEKKGKKK